MATQLAGVKGLTDDIYMTRYFGGVENSTLG